LKQVVLGIVLDDADRPIASFLMPGNTADVTLLLPVVKRLRERFGIAEACIVADRGMTPPVYGSKAPAASAWASTATPRTTAGI
jgi:hypothetical protein